MPRFFLYKNNIFFVTNISIVINFLLQKNENINHTKWRIVMKMNINKRYKHLLIKKLKIILELENLLLE